MTKISYALIFVSLSLIACQRDKIRNGPPSEYVSKKDREERKIIDKIKLKALQLGITETPKLPTPSLADEAPETLSEAKCRAWMKKMDQAPAAPVLPSEENFFPTLKNSFANMADALCDSSNKISAIEKKRLSIVRIINKLVIEEIEINLRENFTVSGYSQKSKNLTILKFVDAPLRVSAILADGKLSFSIDSLEGRFKFVQSHLKEIVVRAITIESIEGEKFLTALEYGYENSTTFTCMVTSEKRIRANQKVPCFQ